MARVGAPSLLRRNEKKTGQGLVEYLVLVALVAVASIAIVRVVGTNLQEQYARISHAIRGSKASEVPLTAPGKDTYRRRSLKDFAEDAE